MIGGFDAFTVIMIAVFAVGSLLFLMGVCLFPSKNMDGKLLYFSSIFFILNMDLFVNNFFSLVTFLHNKRAKTTYQRISIRIFVLYCLLLLFISAHIFILKYELIVVLYGKGELVYCIPYYRPPHRHVLYFFP